VLIGLSGCRGFSPTPFSFYVKSFILHIRVNPFLNPRLSVVVPGVGLEPTSTDFNTDIHGYFVLKRLSSCFRSNSVLIGLSGCRGFSPTPFSFYVKSFILHIRVNPFLNPRLSVVVPGVGLEPTRPKGQRILSPPRLPNSATQASIYIISYHKFSGFIFIFFLFASISLNSLG
jgi:hypothetical protein